LATVAFALLPHLFGDCISWPVNETTQDLSIQPGAGEGSSYSQAPVTGERLKVFGNGPAQFSHEFYFFSIYLKSV
jgi:hypothetical protein